MDEPVRMILDNGVSVVIIGLVCYLGIKLVNMIPKVVEQRMQNEQKKRDAQANLEMERNKRYDEQMEILVTVTQQGIEAQKRGNSVIEQNTEVIKRALETEEKLNMTVAEFQKELREIKVGG